MATEKKTLTIASVAQPRAGKIFGLISASNDRGKYMAKPEIIDQMQRGNTYICSVSSKEYPDGLVWFVNQVSETQQPAQAQGTPDADPMARNIFICGVVQRAMQSGQFRVDQVVDLTKEAMSAWDLIAGKKKTDPGIDFEDELSDSVPF